MYFLFILNIITNIITKILSKENKKMTEAVNTDKNHINPRKVGIIGCGFVGAACGFALMESGLFSEMVLLDVDRSRAEGEAMDISHGIPFAKPARIYAGDYADMADAAILVLTAGANQKPEETRLDLVHKNAAIFKSIIPQITETGFAGILLVVSNPVDILTFVAAKLSGYTENRVIGSGTVLDTARLKYAVAHHLTVDSRSVHAFIIGEHGDSEIAAWSGANISGIPLADFCELRGHYAHAENTEKIAEAVKNSAYEIIAKKKATYFGIAMAVRRICEVILRDEKSILPVSSMMYGEYGISDVALSMPVILGKNGVETKVPIPLSDKEIEQLQQSASMLRDILDEVEE
jgi:L-lactate dehydrogenase